MNTDIQEYNSHLLKEEREICDSLADLINGNLPESESKVWHDHPVWFLNGNPIVGYAKLKDSVQLLFWSGQSFEEKGLKNEGGFKAAEVRYTDVSEINKEDLKRWLKKSTEIQWDYKNIVKNRGKLSRII